MVKERGALGFLPKEALPGMVDNLRRLGYTVIGPRERDGVAVLGEIENADRIARGFRV